MLEQQVLFFGLPIHLNENTTIYQPTLNEIIEKGFSFERILEPFIALDKRKFEQETKNEKINDFDMLFIQMIIGYIQHLTDTKDNIGLTEWINSDKSDWLIIKKLIEVLKFLMKTEDISLYVSDVTKGLTDTMEDNYIIVNKSYKIDRDTFNDLKDLVCEMLDTEITIDTVKPQKVERTEEEKRLDRLFEEKRKQYEKEYGKKTKREKNKDNMTIFTLINYIIHYEHTQYNYVTIRNLTIYQIKNTFKYYHGQEMYDIDMKYRTSGNFKMDKKSAEHWFFDK